MAKIETYKQGNTYYLVSGGRTVTAGTRGRLILEAQKRFGRGSTEAATARQAAFLERASVRRAEAKREAAAERILQEKGIPKKVTVQEQFLATPRPAGAARIVEPEVILAKRTPVGGGATTTVQSKPTFSDVVQSRPAMAQQQIIGKQPTKIVTTETTVKQKGVIGGIKGAYGTYLKAESDLVGHTTGKILPEDYKTISTTMKILNPYPMAVINAPETILFKTVPKSEVVLTNVRRGIYNEIRNKWPTNVITFGTARAIGWGVKAVGWAKPFTQLSTKGKLFVTGAGSLYAGSVGYGGYKAGKDGGLAGVSEYAGGEAFKLGVFTAGYSIGAGGGTATKPPETGGTGKTETIFESAAKPESVRKPSKPTKTDITKLDPQEWIIKSRTVESTGKREFFLQKVAGKKGLSEQIVVSSTQLKQFHPDTRGGGLFSGKKAQSALMPSSARSLVPESILNKKTMPVLRYSIRGTGQKVSDLVPRKSTTPARTQRDLGFPKTDKTLDLTIRGETSPAKTKPSGDLMPRTSGYMPDIFKTPLKSPSIYKPPKPPAPYKPPKPPAQYKKPPSTIEPYKPAKPPAPTKPTGELDIYKPSKPPAEVRPKPEPRPPEIRPPTAPKRSEFLFPGLPGLFPMLPGEGGGYGFKWPSYKQRSKQRVGYAPSLIATTFDIYGTAPRGQISGLEFRPIPGAKKKKKKKARKAKKGRKRRSIWANY